jgi:predicted GTPase
MVTMGRLVRMNKSLVTSEPGTTRDRVYAYCDIGGRSVMVRTSTHDQLFDDDGV